MEWNLDFCTDVYAEVAHALGVPASGDDRADAVKGIAEVRKLSTAIGVPQTLSAAGATEDQLDEIAGATMGDGSIFTNPRPVGDQDEVLALLKQAF
jgi:alcohol dehydrogenase class IV